MDQWNPIKRERLFSLPVGLSFAFFDRSINQIRYSYDHDDDNDDEKKILDITLVCYVNKMNEIKQKKIINTYEMNF